MDTTQLLLDEIIAITATPLFLFPLIAIALAWRSVKRRALYSLLAFLSFWGLQSFFYPTLRHIFNPPLGPATYPSPTFTLLVVSALLAAAAGFPILWWLRNALRNT
ncbi:MAG: hypothetical protein JSS26_20335 [Nitrospira sp.]|nr:hypothetical protein [Nitrospira sp.]